MGSIAIERTGLAEASGANQLGHFEASGLGGTAARGVLLLTPEILICLVAPELCRTNLAAKAQNFSVRNKAFRASSSR